MSDQKQQVHIRLQAATVERLTVMAKQERRTRTQQIEHILEQYLSQQKQQR